MKGDDQKTFLLEIGKLAEEISEKVEIDFGQSDTMILDNIRLAATSVLKKSFCFTPSPPPSLMVSLETLLAKWKGFSFGDSTLLHCYIELDDIIKPYRGKK